MEQQTIKELSAALVEALIHLCIVKKAPPYRVPYKIHGDLWQYKVTRSPTVAVKTIKQAVAEAAKR